MLLVTSLQFKEKRCGKGEKHSASLIYNKRKIDCYFLSDRTISVTNHVKNDRFIFTWNLCRFCTEKTSHAEEQM